MDSVLTGVLLLDFAQPLHRKNADDPDIYFTLVDTPGISPALVLNQNAKTKERGGGVPFKILTSEAAKIVHAGRCCFWVNAQLDES